MAFLEYREKLTLREVEMLPIWAYTRAELQDIVTSEVFYSWSALGYYTKRMSKYIKEVNYEQV